MLYKYFKDIKWHQGEIHFWRIKVPFKDKFCIELGVKSLQCSFFSYPQTSMFLWRQFAIFIKQTQKPLSCDPQIESEHNYSIDLGI